MGSTALDTVTSEQAEVPAARIRVTDECAASGHHSLKCTNAPGQRNRFGSHVYYQPHMTSGVASGSFTVCVEAGVDFIHEWRTDGNPHQTGPSLRIANGHLSVGGKELIAIPLGQFVHIAITTGLGADAHGRWNLSVTLPGGQVPTHFAGLTCSERFTQLDWMGFVSDADTATVSYLDDIDLHATQAR